MAAPFDFARMVRAHFAFLERRGLRIARDEPFLVRYEDRLSVVEIRHEPREWAIDVSVGRTATTGAFYSLAELVAAFPFLIEPAPSFPTGRDDRLLAALERQASLLEALPPSVLSGDVTAFDRVEDARADAVDNGDARRHRARAQEAWLSEDYRTVVTELKSIPVPLSPAEAKKLQIAQERVRLLPRLL